MLSSERNFLLSQLEDVLSEVQCLVSNLMSVKCEDDPVQPSQEDDDVSSVTSLQSRELLWDTSEDFPVYKPTPSHFYSLVYNEEISDEEFEFCQSEAYCESKPIVKECQFVAKIKSFLSSSFPNNVYDNQRLIQQRLNESVFIEFQSLWRNVDDLFDL